MTTISNNLPTFLTQSLATPNGVNTSSGNSLLATVEQELSGSSGANSNLQGLVSLGGNQANQSPTYNAQGLINQMQSVLLLNDPLLQTSNSDASSSDALDSLLGGNTSSSALDSLLGTNTGGNATDSSNLLQDLITSQTAGSSSTAGNATSNTALAQALKQNPSLASDLMQASIDQSTINLFS